VTNEGMKIKKHKTSTFVLLRMHGEKCIF